MLTRRKNKGSRGKTLEKAISTDDNTLLAHVNNFDKRMTELPTVVY